MARMKPTQGLVTFVRFSARHLSKFYISDVMVVIFGTIVMEGELAEPYVRKKKQCTKGQYGHIHKMFRRFGVLILYIIPV